MMKWHIPGCFEESLFKLFHLVSLAPFCIYKILLQDYINCQVVLANAFFLTINSRITINRVYFIILAYKSVTDVYTFLDHKKQYLIFPYFLFFKLI